MGRIVPLGQIHVGSALPDNTYRVCIGGLEEVMTREAVGKVQKYMLKLQGKVVEPKAFAGRLYFDNFVIGTDDDPDAEDLDSWRGSMGGKQFKGFTEKTGLPFSDEEDIDNIISMVKGVEVLASVVSEIQAKTNRDGSPNRFAGKISNNTTAYWAIGEREPGDAAVVSTTPVAAAKRGRPVGSTNVKPAAVAAVKAAPTTTLRCSACNERVERAAFPAHIKQHQDDDAVAATGEAPGPAGDEDE